MPQKKDEWGNRELPGLSDEELFTKQWNKIAHAQTKINNPEFSKTMTERFKIVKQTDHYQQHYQEGMTKRNNTYQATSNSRPEVKEKISKSLKQYQKTDEHKARVAEQNRLRSKTIQTPYGIFASRKQAVEHLLNQGINNAGKKIDKWLKTNPTEYYYLDK